METTSSQPPLFHPAMRSAYTSIQFGEAGSLEEWLYNGGTYQLVVFHFLLGIFAYMGREWELSYRLGMRPWIFVAYSAPVAAASAVFLCIHLDKDHSQMGCHSVSLVHSISCLYSRRNIIFSCTHSICLALLVYLAGVFLVLCTEVSSRPALYGGDHRNGIPKLWIQVWSRGRDLQHRCCSWILWTSDLSVCIIQ